MTPMSAPGCWRHAMREARKAVFVDIHPEDCTLDLDDLRRKLTARTRLLAVSCASNAVGTINDVRSIARLAHEARALIYVDAVHYAPYKPIDVQDWDCDFLACSAYKFFGPHVGILGGVRSCSGPCPLTRCDLKTADTLPGSVDDRGRKNHEGLAGVAAAVDYLASGAGLRCGQISLEISQR